MADQTPTPFDRNIIPEAYRDKPYLKDVDSYDKLFSAFDGAQTLLGKRPAGIPQDTAPEEEFKSFYSVLRPKDAAEYELPETEFSKKVGRTDEAKAMLKGILHKADISKYQAKKLMPEFDNFLGAFAQQQEAAKQAEEKKYDDTLTSLYGGNRAQVVERATKLLGENIPDALKPNIKNMSTETLLMMTALSESIHAKYIKDDKLNAGGEGGGGTETVDSLNLESQKIMGSPEYKDFRHAGHEAARAKVEALSNRIAALARGGK